jgi:hypothetical protein
MAKLKTNLNKKLLRQLWIYDKKAHYRACRVPSASSTATSILSAFEWLLTKEGLDYWDGVHRGMLRSIPDYGDI